ncbi:putative ribonuclease H-like domain-containing protein [Tanacetum coccineum]
MDMCILHLSKDKGDILLVHVYVDDIIFGSTKNSLCDEFEGLMHKRFQMSSMGELTFFLGLHVQQKEDRIFISQDKYVAEILKKFDFTTVKTASTPIETNKALVKDEEAEAVDVHLYRSMIGSLMYLTDSKPDIMFAVCACVRFQVTPKTSHIHAVKRIFRYLKGQPKLGLWYPTDSPFDLGAFSNSDYAGASLDRKSITGEYVAAANCCGQVLWIQNQMLDYGFNFMNTKIYIDNESTICIVKNPVFHSKTKHIEIRHHFIRDSYEKKLIQVIKIHTDHNVADLLIKAFDEDRMEKAATTASSIDAEQESGSGTRCHVTILGGADAQTRFEAASKQSNDPPLSRGYTLGSGEDSMKLNELMELCIKLSDIAECLSEKEMRDIVSLKTERELVRINSDDGNAFCNEIKVNAAGLLTTVRHNILWATTKANMVNGERQIQALVDNKKVIITETSIRSDLHLEDADGTDCFPTNTIFKELARMGKKQKKNTNVPHPSDSTADVPNKEHVPTHSNDPLLSGEDRMKLTELMDMCTKFSERVLNLEHTKTAQAQEITNLKLRVKKLEKKAGLRTHKFKRLYKGRSRIEAIDKDAEVTLVETQRKNDENDDNLMFDTGVFDSDEIVVETEEPVINAATTTKSIPVSIDEIDLAQEITLAHALAAIKMVSTATTTVVATPAITTPLQQRAKGIAFKETVESTITTTVPSHKSKDKGNVIMIEPKNLLKKKDQMALDEELAREIEVEEAAIYEEWDNEQAMMEAAYELAANLQENEREAMSIEEKLRRLAKLIRERKKLFAAQRVEAIRNKPPIKTQRRNKMIQYLKSMTCYSHAQLKDKSFDEV